MESYKKEVSIYEKEKFCRLMTFQANLHKSDEEQVGGRKAHSVFFSFYKILKYTQL